MTGHTVLHDTFLNSRMIVYPLQGRRLVLITRWALISLTYFKVTEPQKLMLRQILILCLASGRLNFFGKLGRHVVLAPLPILFL